MTEVESLAFKLIDTLEAENKARADYFDEFMDGDTYTPLKNAVAERDRIIKRLTTLRKTTQ